ncbi:acyl carrier protein [Pseudomaricurvus sp. HS19]|uniref:acyl carrier protein n=1 Tax=Pseudomaricurvus sp. HS19 TaxID=2692626 RepID=UPI00136FCEBE|nr:acyl carrier protein [Pseudomaricurvus sp. HS19]MYM63985.1 acyl carrier protein [Pseudomaricurvus sp. HS19]
MNKIPQTQAEIYQYIVDAMVRLFELDADDITPESHLYQDLDIDSIDAVDLVVELKQWTGKKIQPEAFKSVRTVQDVVEAVELLLKQQ